ncbi:MAG TPA: ATP synthase F1 subunit delta [Lachnospiraceae bacterium]|nr:ATP synthase F1 subunit delta [Lachnospiraceae bacterium]
MTQTARVYGGSLYDLAVEENMTDEMLRESEEIRKIFWENPDYLHLLSEPVLAKEERIGLIEEAFGSSASRYMVNFLKILCERNILNEYSGCVSEFVRRYNADHNIAEAVVVTAAKLGDDQMNALKEKLEAQFGKKIYLSQRLDAGVIGGLKVELEDMELDGTVKGRLTGIQNKLNNIMM